MNNNWTPELRKQHRKMLTNWRRSTPRDPETLAKDYACWRWEQGISNNEPVSVFPYGKSARAVSDRTRQALEELGLRVQLTIDPENYI